MTSLSAAAQRVWRSRGNLAPLNGTRAQFTVRDAASIAIRFELGLYGISPRETAQRGLDTIPSVLYFLLMNSSGVCEVLAADDQILDESEEEFDRDDNFIRRIAGLGPLSDPVKFLFKPSGAEITSEMDLDSAQTLAQSNSAMYVDVEAVAAQIGLRATKPLLTLVYGKAARHGASGTLHRVLNRRSNRQP